MFGVVWVSIEVLGLPGTFSAAEYGVDHVSDVCAVVAFRFRLLLFLLDCFLQLGVNVALDGSIRGMKEADSNRERSRWNIMGVLILASYSIQMVY